MRDGAGAPVVDFYEFHDRDGDRVDGRVLGWGA
jgi:hypothetical protein